MALNETKKLPRILLVIPDCDLLEYINFCDSGKSHVIGANLEWLINNIDQALTCEKEDLRHIRGAVMANEPKIIWVKMLNRSLGGFASERINLINELADTFNSILEEILSTRKNSFVVNMNEDMLGLSTYSMGRLTGHG